jgi:hypothetical protein
LTSLNTNVNTDQVVNKTLQSDYFLGPNHNSTSKKLFFKIPLLNLAEQSRQTFEFSGLFPFLRHFKSEKHLIIQNLFLSDEQLKLANLQQHLHLVYLRVYLVKI